MSAQWLTIIGVTEQGIEALPRQNRKLIEGAKAVFGAQRFLSQLPSIEGQKKNAWASPFSAMIEKIIAQKGINTIILASGDPNWFGIGSTLASYLTPDEYEIICSPSSFQLGAASLGWPMQEVKTLSFHARKTTNLQTELYPGARILALTSDRTTLSEVCSILVASGFANSKLHVLENLGGTNERKTSFLASEVSKPDIGDFYVLAIACVADGEKKPALPIAGLPDDAFEHDGQITKRHVRAITLSSLAPNPDELLWDIGAGSGSIGIEWMRASSLAKAICFEKDPDRCERIKSNKLTLGTPDLEVICGDAQQSVSDLGAPDAIFIGGDVANEKLFDICWNKLKPGGRLVANAVTLQATSALTKRQTKYGGELCSIAISCLRPLGAKSVLQPGLPVLQWVVIKPYQETKQ